MRWKETTLGEGIHIKHGFGFKSEYFDETGEFVILTPGNFYEEGGFRPRPGKDRYYKGDFNDNFILKSNDLIVAMTEQAPGLLGSSAIIPEDNKYLHNQRLGLVTITNESLFHKKFLYFLFNTHSVRGQISGSASGTKVRHTAPERVYNVKVKIPDISTQKRISEISSAYDDLIENNRRRIQLLEEAARLLYQEWFIRLRFPGYEHTKIVDGVPEGWNRVPLGETTVFNYGKALKEENRIPGFIPVYGSSGIVGYHEKPLVEGPGIVIGRKGNVGSIYWAFSDYHPIDTVYYVNREESSFFLYYALLNISFVNTDVAVPGLNRTYAYSRTIIWPTQIIMEMFDDVVTPIHSQIFALNRYSESLVKTRDLLLPRLMNGVIPV